MGHYLLKTNTVHVIASKAEYCTYDYGTRQPDYPTHKGIDIINAVGGACEVIAAADGEVVSVQNHIKGHDEVYTAGNMVRIKHDSGLYTRYLHMQYETICVKVGQKVKAGDKLGVMGNTGYSFGTHLHFDVYDGKNYIDPLPFLMGDKLLTKNTPDNQETYATVKLMVGDKVKVKPGAKFTNGAKPYDFVFNTEFDIMQISKSGRSALIGLGGKVTGWFYINNLIASSSTAPIEKTIITVGDKVRVKQGANTYFGDSLASFVYKTVYDVIQVGTRNEPGYIVIGIDGKVTAAVNIEDLVKI